MAQPYILGYASSHNGGACLLKGDRILAAVQEERLLRQKRAYHLGSKASLSTQYCLEAAGIQPSDLSMVVFSSMRDNGDILEDITLNPSLRIAHNRVPTASISHHLAHAVGAYATSGYKDAAVLVIDGCGSPMSNLSSEERAAILPLYRPHLEQLPPQAINETATIYSVTADGFIPVAKHVSPIAGVRQWPLSLGHMYEAVASKIFGLGLEGAGKVMGLAPYGHPKFPPNTFFEFVDGTFVFHDEAIEEVSRHYEKWPSCQQEHSDLAASVQCALEIGVLHLVRQAFQLTRQTNLCYAGGVALNSIANERIFRESPFKEVFIMPAAEDSGTAIGAAYYGLWKLTGAHSSHHLRCDAVGRKYDDDCVAAAIANQAGIVSSRHKNIVSRAVDLMIDGSIIGWFQGGSELGPRALGQRSILCDPRQPGMKDRLNRKVKHRETFRPFAPAVLKDHVGEWFEVDSRFAESPYMLRVLPVLKAKRDYIPAVVHVDGSGRLQTVGDVDDPVFHSLLKCFYEKTGCPILLNTSFNVAGEPIVETPDDAIRCFLMTDMDFCIINDFLIQKDNRCNSVLALYPRLSSKVLWMDLLARHPLSPIHTNNHAAAGLLRSFHIDYFNVVDITTMLGKFHTNPLAQRTTDELLVCQQDDLARIVTRSKWGLIVHLLSRHLFSLVKAIDGTLSCAELLDKTARIAPPLQDQAAFLRSIASLARASIITLAPKKCTGESASTGVSGKP